MQSGGTCAVCYPKILFRRKKIIIIIIIIIITCV